MIRSFFPKEPAQGRAGTAPRVFYDRPPLGFALVGFPHVGYLMVLEMVGLIFISPCSEPFFLGSEVHRRSMEILGDIVYADPVSPRSDLVWSTPSDAGARGQIMWAIDGDKFLKVISSSQRDAKGFSNLYKTYALLARYYGTSTYRPSAIVPGRLLYGEHEVMIESEAVLDAQECSDGEVTGGTGPQDAPLLRAVVKAIVWLATELGILYTDLRGPNVLKGSNGGVRLVDYDDCIVVPGGQVTSFAAFMDALPQGDPRYVFVENLRHGQYPVLQRALQDEFRAHGEARMELS